MKYIYALLLIAVLLFIVQCDCQSDPIDPKHYWVICVSKNTPALTNGTNVVTGRILDPADWSCEDTSGSPAWVGAGVQIWGTRPLHSLAKSSAPRALTPGSAAYLPQLLLDLPFPAFASASDSTAITCDPSQPDVLQVNHDNALVNRISTCPFAPVARIPVAGHPLQINLTPDGTTALVTSFDNAINFIDLSSNKVTFTLSTPGFYPNGIAITPDGANFYVTNFLPSGASIAEYSMSTHQQIFSMPAPAYPQNMAISPDGTQLFVTFPYENQVWILDTLTNSLVFTVSIQGPRGVAFNSKGTKAYIASVDNPDQAVAPGVVREFNTTTFQFGNTYNVGVGPNDVAVLYGDQFVAVNNYEGKSISKIDTVRGTVTTTPVSGQPSGFSIVY